MCDVCVCWQRDRLLEGFDCFLSSSYLSSWLLVHTNSQHSLKRCMLLYSVFAWIVCTMTRNVPKYVGFRAHAMPIEKWAPHCHQSPPPTKQSLLVRSKGNQTWTFSAIANHWKVIVIEVTTNSILKTLATFVDATFFTIASKFHYLTIIDLCCLWLKRKFL